MSVPRGICVFPPQASATGDDVAATRAALSFLPSGRVDAPKSQNLRPDVHTKAACAREFGLRRDGLAPGDRRRTDSLTDEGGKVPLAIAGTGYGLIGILVIVLLIVLILYFVRRA
jgi:hypothetical protein